MKGKINNSGNLIIYRKGIPAEQYCRIGESGSYYCGDDCPLFHEPEKSGNFAGRQTTYLQLCHTKLEFDEFEDER